jgi:hypothetical protein
MAAELSITSDQLEGTFTRSLETAAYAPTYLLFREREPPLPDGI